MGGKRLVSKRSNPLTLSPSKGVKYAIELTPAASREIRKLERLVQRRLVRLLEILAKDPRPRGVETMKSRERFLRVRVGDYRVVYGWMKPVGWCSSCVSDIAARSTAGCSVPSGRSKRRLYTTFNSELCRGGACPARYHCPPGRSKQRPYIVQPHYRPRAQQAAPLR